MSPPHLEKLSIKLVVSVNFQHIYYNNLGKFQWIMMLLVLTAFISGNYMIHGASFFLMQPDYLCKNSTTGKFEVPCQPSDFCDFKNKKFK
jgi:hypothetical protein